MKRILNTLISLILKKCEDIIGMDIEHLRDYIRAILEGVL